MEGIRCDLCDKDSWDDGYYSCTRRPSDPTEMVCVLWFCDACAEPMDKGVGPDGGLGRDETWQRWIEDEGAKHGVLWLTL